MRNKEERHVETVDGIGLSLGVSSRNEERDRDRHTSKVLVRETKRERERDRHTSKVLVWEGKRERER